MARELHPAVSRATKASGPARLTSAIDACQAGAAGLGAGCNAPRAVPCLLRRSMRPSYEQVCAAHRWEVPAHYNIASDVCDKHPRDKLAMVWESFDGSYRELAWGELQDLANQAAHVLRAHGVERGGRVAVVLPATPETAAIFFGVWKLGAILLSMSVLYGDESIRHRLSDSGAKLVVTGAANAGRFDDSDPKLLVLDENTLAGASTEFVCVETSAEEPAQLYYTSGT